MLDIVDNARSRCLHDNQPPKQAHQPGANMIQRGDERDAKRNWRETIDSKALAVGFAQFVARLIAS